MTVRRFNRFLALLACVSVVIAATMLLKVHGEDKPTTFHGDPNAEDSWKIIAQTLGQEGVMSPMVYTITMPRSDLDVQNYNGPVPADAGLSHQFYFYKCSCGKMNVVGQFCVTEYEANDVMDALRSTAGFKVVSVAPMLMEETPRMMSLRFQGEGGSQQLASTLKSALEWTGEARMAPTTKAASQPAQ